MRPSPQAHTNIRATRLTSPTPAPRGFTLVETLFALIVVTVALLSIEGTTTRTLQRVADTHRESLATDIARQQIERLISAHCTTLAGADSVDQVIIQWNAHVTPGIPPVATVVQDTRYPLAIGMHTESLSTVIPCQ